MPKRAFNFYGGWGGIRTPGGVAPTAVFKTVAFDRSATHPKLIFVRWSFKPAVLLRTTGSLYIIFLITQMQNYICVKKIPRI